MTLTDLGFLFLVLPVTVALYYCCPMRLRTMAVFLLSAGLFLLMEPDSAPWILLSLLFDAAAVFFGEQREATPSIALTLFLLAVVKDCSLLAIFGALRPLIQGESAPTGLIVSHISSLVVLYLQRRDRLSVNSLMLFGGYTLLAGHLTMGPIAEPARVMMAIRHPVCSRQKIGQGAFLIISGAMKRVVIAEQLFALYKTLLRLSSGQLSVASAWLTALCPAMGVFFVFSAYSDLALGIGLLFGIELPRMTYYPLQARGARESVYHLNMPLEDLIGHLIFPNFSREDGSRRAILISALMPFALAVFLGLSGTTLLWALWLSAACVIDGIIARKKRRISPAVMRLITFFGLLPAYALLGGTWSQNLTVLGAMVGLGGVPLINSGFLYLILSNAALLIVSILLSTSVMSAVQRWVHRKFPKTWWVLSAAVSIPILVITVSFLV
jgi:alginate O-acetyltransferase complex protein AlgI